MKKHLKKTLAILASLIFTVITSYAAKKSSNTKQAQAKPVQVQQEQQEQKEPAALATKTNAGEKQTGSPGQSMKQSSEKKAPAVTQKTTQTTQTTALPAVESPKSSAPKNKAQAPQEVASHKPAPEESTGWTTIPPPDFQPKFKWHRSNLERHWDKHSAEFPEFRNEQEYGAAALYFFEHPPKGTLTKTNGDGDRMFYHQESNTFGVMTSDGTAKTMFRPSAGINYWRRQ